MDPFNPNFGQMTPSLPQSPQSELQVTPLELSQTDKIAALREKLTINKGKTSGLSDKTSKVSSQDRLMLQVKILGKSTMVSLTALNIALFTPIEFSFGKMTSLTMNAMIICLDKINEQDRKLKKLKGQKTDKKAGLKRMEAAAKKIGALVGFTAMAVLTGGFGSVAVGSAFTIQNSLQLQEEQDE